MGAWQQTEMGAVGQEMNGRSERLHARPLGKHHSVQNLMLALLLPKGSGAGNPVQLSRLQAEGGEPRRLSLKGCKRSLPIMDVFTQGNAYGHRKFTVEEEYLDIGCEVGSLSGSTRGND
ncbi:unnamed protein product [Pleuronectes platessa]|uniref:Uncharacterized protein n=1 Tax=Pleuronectes platessa TaxID=8262 RepID=A0A9N7URA6_PLEPL|nr:unnamed protein product [Pleuronectes platessa]